MLNSFLRIIKGKRNGRRTGDTQSEADSLLGDALHADQENAAATLQRFLGRQPILDQSYRIVGYELKVRSNAPLPLDAAAGSLQQMQDEMLVISVIDLAFQRALGQKHTFISVSPAILENPLIDELPSQNVVLALTPGNADPELLLASCQALTARGIELALEDFNPDPAYISLLKQCRYVRFDTSNYDALALSSKVVELLKLHNPLLIAKQVDTEEAFEAYRKLTFNYFQGYYFTRLQPAQPHRIDNNRMRVMDLLNLVINRVDIPVLEEKVKLDAALSYKLLNYINSPASGLSQKITSIGHALVLLGYDQLYRWLTLLMFTSGETDERSRALLKNALVRGRFSETLGQSKLPATELGGLFIAGIFSLLDALLNVPMDQALSRLNLPEPVTNALLHNKGPYAPYLQLALACENFDQDTIARCSATCGLDADAVNLAHVNALIWSEQIEA